MLNLGLNNGKELLSVKKIKIKQLYGKSSQYFQGVLAFFKKCSVMKKKYLLPLAMLCALLGVWFFQKPTKVAEKIVICGVCKNVAPFLPTTIASIEDVGSRFKDYRVFIYENNSTDGTPEMLRTWAEQNPRVKVISEVIPREDLLKQCRSHTWDNLPYRTEVIARARNIVMKYAMSSELDDYKYLLVADLDFSDRWDIDGIMSSFHQKVEWDALLANGLDQKKHLFDRYALRYEERPLGPELLGEEWWHELHRYPVKLKKEAPLFPVYSAFGGLGIYKRAAVKGCHYSGTITPDLETFARRIIETKPHHSQVLQYFQRNDKDLTVVYLKKDPSAIKWILNSGGFEFPVCCEHVTFHASMIVNGHDKIFINPQMMLQYDPR